METRKIENYKRAEYPTAPNSPEYHDTIDTYAYEVDKQSGKKTLAKNGETNFYKKIQKASAACNIYNIMDRYERGDIEVQERINKVVGSYVDTTQYPKTLAEAQQMIIDAKNSFDKLPAKLKKKFNFSAEEFVAQAGSEEFNDILKDYADKNLPKMNDTPLEAVKNEIKNEGEQK